MLLALVSASMPAVASARSAPSATERSRRQHHPARLVARTARMPPGSTRGASFDALVSNGDALLLAGAQPSGRRLDAGDDLAVTRRLAVDRERAPFDDRHGDRGRGRRRHRARDRRHRPQRRVGLRLAFRRRRGELDRGGGGQGCVRHARARDGPAQRQRIAPTRWMVGCVGWSFRRLRRDLGVARRSPLAAGARSERGGRRRASCRVGPGHCSRRGARSRGSRAM